MANEQNLKPLSTSKAREIGKKGGINSGISRRKKKLIKEQFEMLMSLDLQDDTLKEQITSLGIPVEEITLQMALCVTIIQQALQGNIRAFELIQNTLGQNPMKEQENEERQPIIFINDIKELKDLDLENNN